MSPRLFVPVGPALWTSASDTKTETRAAVAARHPADAVAHALETARSVLDEATRSGYDGTVFFTHVRSVTEARQLARESAALRRAFPCEFRPVVWSADTSVGPMRRASARLVKDALPLAVDRVLPMDSGTLLTRGALNALAFSGATSAAVGQVAPIGQTGPRIRAVRGGESKKKPPRYASDLAPALMFAGIARLHGSLIDAQSFARADVIFGAPSATHDWMFFSGNAFIRIRHCLRITHRAHAGIPGATDRSAGTHVKRVKHAEQDDFAARTLAWATAGLEMSECDHTFAGMLAPRVRQLFAPPMPTPGTPSIASPAGRIATASGASRIIRQFEKTSLASLALFAAGSVGWELIQAAATVFSST